uniref:Borealin C-terminal domain-containing protein n=1 Tax=Glossina palpalis gambiensis TaxID=67801 RepID=A0A1B0BQH2_9MUSC
MPRTKVSKSSKRNRETEYREEKIREYESAFNGYLSTMENDIEGIIGEWEAELNMVRQRTKVKFLRMKMGDFLELNLNSFDDASVCESINSTGVRTSKLTNPNDEGYLTEDSSTGGNVGLAASGGAFVNVSNLHHTQLQLGSRLRTPGPLTSARARRPRRSRSACGDYAPSISSEHRSRSKLGTRQSKAHSTERKSKMHFEGPPTSPPAAFMRWPKPGELVVSKYGSPIIAQVLPDKFANVNIPLRNGVISLRPKKLNELQSDILDAIDLQTLNQLKTLHANLDKIVSMADNKMHK